MAWQHILPEVNVKGFKKCCMSNGMDRSDGGMLWNGSKEDGNLTSLHEEDEDTDCQDGDSGTDW